MQDVRTLFVYGTLRSGFRTPAYQYLAKHFHLVGEGVVHGKFYDKGDYPVAVPMAGPSLIHGELYQSNSADEFAWAIDQLDDYEGLNVEPDEIQLYIRKLVEVLYMGQPVTAWIYWYNGSVEGMPELETGDLLKYLEQKNKPLG